MTGEMLTVNAVGLAFTNVNEIQEFVHMVKDFKGDIDMVQGRTIVDAKSILGICSLNMQSQLELQVQSGDFEALRTKIQKFIK